MATHKHRIRNAFHCEDCNDLLIGAFIWTAIFVAIAFGAIACIWGH